MQFAIEQSVLAPELALVATAVETRSTIRTLSQVRIEARETGAIRLTVNNLEFGLASELPAQVIEPGVICLPAKSLLSLVQALEGEITFHTSVNHYATVIAGSSRSRMPGEPPDTFSDLEAMPGGAIGLPAEILAQMLSRVKFAVAKVAGRFEVPAALLTADGERLFCVGTDGRRLALVEIPLESPPCRFLFPLGAMECVLKLLEGQERACVAAGSQHLFVAAGARLLAARQLAGTFPDYQRVLPHFDTPPALIDRDALRTALGRVELFTDSGKRLDPKMRFTFRAGELALSAASVQGGEGEDAIGIEYAGPEISMTFNSRLVAEYLDVVPQGALRVWIEKDQARTEWRPEKDDTYRYVLMTLRG
jgi:DNA polymerase-3 subunit beta